MPLDKSNSEKTEPSMNVAKKNRAAFFVFYEKDGNVADWVVYYLNALKEVAGTLCVIVNGKLSNSGRELLLTTGAELLLRENFGFDFSAWKVGLEKFGKNRLAEFDEIILCNNSCYGPVVSFAPILKKMDAEEADFWGLLFHAEPPSFPEHLQSYFLVLRKKLVQSEAFSKYWKNLRQPKTYDEARKNEVGFTRYFIDTGFKAVAFVPRGKYSSLNPTIYEPCRLLAEDAFPLVKRKVFSLPYRYFHAQSRGLQARDALAFLDKKNKALAEMIRRDLLKTIPDSRIRENLHHTFFFPDAGTPKPVKNPERVALIVYSYFEDLIDEDLERMKTMPAGSSVFIVVVSEKIKKFWEAKIPELGDRHVEIRVQENRGRNEAAYWLTCRDVIEKYELICVAHDKKSVSIKNRLCAKGFSEHCWENTLKSQIYVENVIEFFDKNPSFGILLPPPPIFGHFTYLVGAAETEGKMGKYMRDVYKRLKLTVPFDITPNAPFGTMFWLRGKAMLPFYRYPWSVQDFPPEPLTPDDTILHALERMYSMFAQEAGYFSAWILPLSNAGFYFDNTYFQISREKIITQEIAENAPKTPDVEICQHVKTRFIKRFIKFYAKKKLAKIFGKK